MPGRGACESFVIRCLIPFCGLLITLLHGVLQPFELFLKILSRFLETTTNPTVHARKVKLVQDQVKNPTLHNTKENRT